MDIEDIKKIMRLVFVEDSPEKYVDDLYKILGLFDELDLYDYLIQDVPPLYHPLEENGIPREDDTQVQEININTLGVSISDHYIVAPPIKGVKRIRRK